MVQKGLFGEMENLKRASLHQFENATVVNLHQLLPTALRLVKILIANASILRASLNCRMGCEDLVVGLGNNRICNMRDAAISEYAATLQLHAGFAKQS